MSRMRHKVEQVSLKVKIRVLGRAMILELTDVPTEVFFNLNDLAAYIDDCVDKELVKNAFEELPTLQQ